MIIAANWLLGLVLVFTGGARPDGYLIHVQRMPLPHPYPWPGVLSFAAFVTLESIMLLASCELLEARPRLARLSALAVFAMLFAFFGLASMHEPPYMAGHLAWLAATAVGIAGSVVVAIVRRLGRGPDNPALQPTPPSRRG